MLKTIVETVSLLADLLAILTSFLAIYIFFAKRKTISTAFKLLLNFTFQTTLTELKGKLERLNEYNANEPSEISEIRNILEEIAGQLKGNRILSVSTKEVSERISALARSKRLTEPQKRAIVSEVREILKDIRTDNFEKFMEHRDE